MNANPEIKTKFEAARTFITEHQRFLMATHARTDGDDCGSMLAIKNVLEQMGKQTTVVAKFGVPEQLSFLPDKNDVLADLPNPVTKKFYDAIILFGCGNIGRPGFEAIEKTDLPILNIDHHPDNKNYGVVNVVEQTKSSVAELVFDFIKFLQVPFNSDIAKCLLTGIFTDTGSFMHSNTQASTLAAAGELMQYGARIDKIHEFTYQNKELSALKAWGRALENTRVIKNGQVAISVITEEDLKELGELPTNPFDGFVEQLNKIPGTKFGMFLRQEGEMVKGSIRSEEYKDMDVSFLAKILGGGGHKLAAGFELKGKLIRLPNNGWKIEKA